MAEPTTNTGETPDGTPQPTGQGETPEPVVATTPQSFDDFLEAQSVEIQTLYEAHTQGLTSALKAERTQGTELTKQLKALLPKAEKGSELEAALKDATAKLDDAQHRNGFLEEAGRPEIGLRPSYLKLAYMAAQADELIDARGRVNWAGLKSAYPDMFGTPTPKGNAGAGTQTPPAVAADMNSEIRRKAGR